MQLKVTLNNLDLQRIGSTASLRGAINSECANYSNNAGVNYRGFEETVPEGAQGEAEVVHFIFELLKEPLAARALTTFLLNLCDLIRAQVDNEAETSRGLVEAKLLNKKIILPAAAATIKQFAETALQDG